MKPCYKKHMEMHSLEPFELFGMPASEFWWTAAQRMTLVLGSLDLFTDTYFAGTMGLGGRKLSIVIGRTSVAGCRALAWPNPKAQLCAPRARRKESGGHGGITVSSDHFQ